ncbi:MAG: LdpA C-terminal domain-containing domain [Cyanobacteria bacterium J06626_14]
MWSRYYAIGVLILHHPFLSLRKSTWFKLICGASYQHLPSIRSLIVSYALAGADCIDIAADPAIVSMARTALDIADSLRGCPSLQDIATSQGRPLLMVSLNDGEDPHFRKATFNPAHCPSDCPRPCERICPAHAIAVTPGRHLASESEGVTQDRCYGCGRCIPVCPIQAITTHAHTTDLGTLAASVLPHVDAIEIHTQVGRVDAFATVWQAIAPFVSHLKLVAVSCPDGENLIPYLRQLYDMMIPTPARLIWQTDGRPMSGDIGNGTTHATIRLAQKVLNANLPGYVQLAGGTNAHTVPKLHHLQLLNGHNRLAGVAYGSYARSLLDPILGAADALGEEGDFKLEHHPTLLLQGVFAAYQLVSQLKGGRFHSTDNDPIDRPCADLSNVRWRFSPSEMPIIS